MELPTTKLFGLILAGGKSTRMGHDKGLIEYHDKPQREYLYELASMFCDMVFYSIRKEQVGAFPKNVPIIVDKDRYQGPFNGILSAHAYNENVAWLVLACDLPLLNKKGLLQLIENRDSGKFATAFSSMESGLPEPLIAIWEPQGLAAAKEDFKNGPTFGPRKFLMDSTIRLVKPNSKDQIYNANRIEDYQIAMEKLNAS